MRKRILLLIFGMVLLSVAPAIAQDSSDLNKGDPETRKLLEQGSRLFLDGDYKRAIPPYQKALDREKENRTLGDTIWRVMVDNLGMAYGIYGDLKKAKEIFEYGLYKDLKYPKFNYRYNSTIAYIHGAH